MNARRRQLVQMIINGQTQFKLKDCEAMFNVGERTVRYDLEHVAGWLEDYDVTFTHASGQGYWELAGALDADKRRELDEAMNLYGRSDAAEERYLLIAYELLIEPRSQSLRELAEELEVSRGTVLQEMEKVEQLTDIFSLTLERGRKGFAILGSEKAKRLALLSVMSRLEAAWNSMNPVPYLNWSEISMKEMEKAVALTEELPETISPTAFLKVWMLQLQRMRTGEMLQEEQPKAEPWFEEVWHEFCQTVGVDTTERNMAFACCYLKATSNLYPKDVPDYNDDPVFLAFVEETSTRMGLTGYSDEQIRYIYREWQAFHYAGECGIRYLHPLKKKVEEQYPFIVFHVQEALGTGPERTADDIIPIAMSFAAIYEKASFDNERYQIWVMCPGGIAAGRLLTASLMKHFPQLDVKRTAAVSMLHKDNGWDKPDFIVSTVTLPDSPYPYVTINPVMTRDEITKVEHFMKDLEEKRGAAKLTETTPSVQALIPASRTAVMNTTDLDEILETGVALLKEDEVVEAAFLEDIRKTVIDKAYLYEIVPGLLFVHTHSNHVNRPGFSLVQLMAPYRSEKLHSHAVLFMATPDKYAHLPQLQYLYQLLTNSDSMQQLLHGEIKHEQ
ncbi:BglG family transcription antiterminator [Bacillus daqingensis]|uniref:BglG family transcription antiterminator n=1 Tax=Bacillus daqingensis TaxID=872396 RepID=A0ABV9NV31_9BACI